MKTLSRRTALKGGAAVAVAAAVGAPATAGQEDPALAAVREWRRAWAGLLKAEQYFADSPDLARDLDRYCDSPGPDYVRAYYGANKRLWKTRPTTVEGAVAILGCVTTIFAIRELGRNDPDALVPKHLVSIYCCQGEEWMVRNAYDGLRLAGGAS